MWGQTIVYLHWSEIRLGEKEGRSLRQNRKYLEQESFLCSVGAQEKHSIKKNQRQLLEFKVLLISSVPLWFMSTRSLPIKSRHLSLVFPQDTSLLCRDYFPQPTYNVQSPDKFDHIYCLCRVTSDVHLALCCQRLGPIILSAYCYGISPPILSHLLF